ncbi:uncharacterized protein PITG_00247 [Phytophthora infestans T30-4]|uniref:Uncharacterized protein n=1 Tax=Phytophthora infestans (strain T30-4) TaxID=403677 RepID=D0MQB3_PHYIT|nr:uncharacterized protein PITG_00247 [Phytophthora infestans T30-4]EEY57682.1 conserved hypothetical protein [Phytophthora infestans T30-4]|eukprot:XP_002908868.1 conserved hypothetical protein [Phytophthora infestans T30-4]
MVTVKLQPASLQSNCLELIMFGTPDAVVCHSSSGSFFHRPPSTITLSTRKVEPLGEYSLVLTTQPLTRKPLDKDAVQLLLLKSTPSELGVGNGVLPVERALQEAQLFTRELFRVAAQHCELEFQLKILSLTTCQIQELGGLDGCFRLKQINAQNNCIRIIQVVVVPFVARLVCSSSGKL